MSQAVVVKSLRPERRRLALIIAIAADVLQWAFLPLFVPIFPAIAVVDDAIDVIVAIVMVRLLGWHLAFLPTIAAELVPGVGLLPTWTAAVWLVTRKKKVEKAEVISVSEPPAEPPKLP